MKQTWGAKSDSFSVASPRLALLGRISTFQKRETVLLTSQVFIRRIFRQAKLIVNPILFSRIDTLFERGISPRKFASCRLDEDEVPNSKS